MTMPSEPSTATVSRRERCAACLRAQSACICRWVAPVDTSVELLVLQHPLEVNNAKNSARLLHLCLAGSRLEVGEAFEPAALDALLHGGRRRPVLLYPDTPGDAALGIAAPPRLDARLLDDPAGLRLVVLDGTWRKSRKMLYLNPALQRLPRYALQDVRPSSYRIRKAHAPHQLSTLEAAAHALSEMERKPAILQALGAIFDGFVQQQAARIPRLNPS